jgi:putative sigma-54 modulation protein
MEVEYTARQVKISKSLRTQAEEGMERIARSVGRSASASIVFTAQKHLQIAELTIKARLQTIVAAGKADTQEQALRQALEHAEHQSRKHRDRRMEAKRLPKEEKVLTALPVARPKARVALTEAKTTRATAKKRAPRRATFEPHILRGDEAIAQKVMTLEEAVKDTESRDQDLLIFRNPAGEQYVLHRRRNGEIELVEIP